MSDRQGADQSDDQTETQVQKPTDNQGAIAALERTLLEAFPDPEARAAILGWIAEDVRRAHGVRPASWSLTLRPTGELSLNVGRLQVLEIGPKQVRYVKMEPERSGETAPVPEVTQEPFSFLPGARLLSAPPGAFPLLFRGDIATHQQLVEQAAAETARTPFFIHHSAPALAWLEEQVGGALPRPEYGDEAPSPSESFVWYFRRFVEEFLWQEIGRQHMAWYEDHRARGLANYRQLLAARERGEDVTDAVLLKLLPYKNSEANRTAGAWTHLAPAINGNVKLWFERIGWAKPREWPAKALRLLAFFESCEKAPGEFEAICSEYASDPLSKGFSAGMLSPLLNAIDPVRFRLTNAKPREVVGWQLGQSFDQRLTSFAALNAAIAELTSAVSGEMHSISESDAPPADLFDAFCHWLVAESGVPVPPPLPGLPQIQPRFWKIAAGERADSWPQWKADGLIAIGWEDLGDVGEMTAAEFEVCRKECEAKDRAYTANGAGQVWRFARDMRSGDRVVVNRGTREVLAIGTVLGDYSFEAGAEMPHRRRVRWDDLTPRSVNKPGWRRTLIELSQEDFDALANAAPEPLEVREASGWFGPLAFRLLGELKASPYRDTYLGKRESLLSEVDEPLRELFRSVVAQLPPEVLEFLETENNVQSRFPKNDYGRGGVWPFLWAAAYPKGGRRVDAAQLYLFVSADGLEAGFTVADAASEVRSRFLRNLKRLRPILRSEVAPQIGPMGLAYGTGVVDGGAPSPEDARRWLEQVDEDSINVFRQWSAGEVPDLSREALTMEIAGLFEALYPLFLLGALDDPLPSLRRFLGEPAEEEPLLPVRSLADICEQTGFALQKLGHWVQAIERKKQAVIYGPPGTGKTFVAGLLAEHLAGGGNGFIELLQFHPSYSYEEFIQGLRPQEAASGGLRFEMVPGRFVEFCRKAAERSGKCVLILDEINRAHLSRVFGELMFLLEYRDQTIPLAGGDRFGIPANVRIIGTMNTADRSIALVDHALRRRFAFLELCPDYGVLSRFQEARMFDASGLVSLLQRVNQSIADPHYEIGISFFLVDNLAGQLEHIWRMEIEPYLEEIFFDRRTQLEEFRWDRIRAEVLPN